MKVHIFEKQVELPNSAESVQQILTMIEDATKNHDFYFTNVVIDGHEIYDEIEFSIHQHVEHIDTIEVVLLTKHQLVDGLLRSIAENVEYLFSIAETTINDLYAGGNERAWKNFNHMLNIIQNLLQAIDSACSSQLYQDVTSEIQNISFKIQGDIKELFSAMEKQDFSLVADLLKYEMLPNLKLVKDTVAKYTEREETEDDF